MGRRVRSIRRDVAVRCLDCDTEYTATETVHEQYSDESFIGQHVDPLSGLCPNPKCQSYRKERV